MSDPPPASSTPPRLTPIITSGNGSSSTLESAPSSVSPSQNRFGLSLSFIQRRRGNSSSTGSNSNNNNDAALAAAAGLSDMVTPSPTKEPGSKGGYGFPALRRRLSRSAGSSSTSTAMEQAGSSTGGVFTLTAGGSGALSLSNGSSSSSSNSSIRRPDTRRTLTSELLFSSRATRPNTAGASAAAPLQPLSPLTATVSLPEGAGGAATTRSSVRPIITTGLVASPSSSSTVPTAGAGASLSSAAASPIEVSSSADSFHIRLVPHLESNRSLHFDPVDRTLACFSVVSVGRFTDRSAVSRPHDPARIAFKSKVVSRGHADIWCDNGGKFMIKDTKSSSGTFLNHIRLSGPGTESRPFPLKDGDILQLGVDYQGGTEEIYKCVKMRVELNRGWQRKKSSFNTNAMKQLRELGAGSNSAMVDADKSSSSPVGSKTASSSVTDCCICLYPVTICQALFIAPCSHVTHFKCIRPLLNKHYPGFTCPLCRTYCDLEADVEVDEPWEPDVVEESPSSIVRKESDVEDEAGAEEGLEASEEISGIGDETANASIVVDGEPSAPFLVGIDIPGLSSSQPAHGPSASSFDTSSTTPIRSSNNLLASPDNGFASLADAATPRNHLFLSTLAETTFSRLSSNAAAAHLPSASSPTMPAAPHRSDPATVAREETVPSGSSRSSTASSSSVAAASTSSAPSNTIARRSEQKGAAASSSNTASEEENDEEREGEDAYSTEGGEAAVSSSVDKGKRRETAMEAERRENPISTISLPSVPAIKVNRRRIDENDSEEGMLLLN